MYKTLKLYNKTGYTVEYALTRDPVAPPGTTVHIPPGEMSAPYVQPNINWIWWRYHGDPSWCPPAQIPDHPSPVYWWKFTPGPRPNLEGAFEEVGH